MEVERKRLDLLVCRNDCTRMVVKGKLFHETCAETCCGKPGGDSTLAFEPSATLQLRKDLIAILAYELGALVTMPEQG